MALSDDFGSTARTAGKLGVGVGVGVGINARIDYVGDIDWFAVQVHEGNAYRFSARTNANDGKAYTVRAVDANGTVIPSVWDADKSTNVFAPIKDETIYLAVSARTPSLPTSTGTYKITTAQDILTDQKVKLEAAMSMAYQTEVGADLRSLFNQMHVTSDVNTEEDFFLLAADNSVFNNPSVKGTVLGVTMSGLEDPKIVGNTLSGSFASTGIAINASQSLETMAATLVHEGTHLADALQAAEVYPYSLSHLTTEINAHAAEYEFYSQAGFIGGYVSRALGHSIYHDTHGLADRNAMESSYAATLDPSQTPKAYSDLMAVGYTADYLRSYNYYTYSANF